MRTPLGTCLLCLASAASLFLSTTPSFVHASSDPQREEQSADPLTDTDSASEERQIDLEAPPEPSSLEATDSHLDAQPPPTRIISDFEDPLAGNPPGLATEFGFGWRTSTDSLRGADSTVTLERVETGFPENTGVMEVKGEIRRGSPYTWAGAKLILGDNPTQPVDLSDSSELIFWARSDGGSYHVSLFTKSRGKNPHEFTFEPGHQWVEYRLLWSDFKGADPSEITAILFAAGPDIRPFQFQLDQIAVR